MKKVFPFFLFCVLCVIIQQGYLYVRGDFRPGKIIQKLDTEVLTPECSQNIQDLLEQKFIYLNRGHDFYAFASEDGQYVLKIPRYKFYPSFWHKLFYFTKKKIKIRKHRREILTSRFEIVKEHFKNEPGMLYLHFAETDLFHKKITLIDKLGRKIQIDLDRLFFYLQRRFTTFGTVLKKCIQKQNQTELREIFASSFELVGSRYAKGLINEDVRGWDRNYGVFDDLIYELDLGGIDLVGGNKVFSKELAKSTFFLRKWMNDYAPEYIHMFDEEYQKALIIPPVIHAENRQKKVDKFSKI